MTRTILLALALAIPASSALGAPGSRALPTADLQARSLSLLEDRFLAAEDPDSDLRVTRMHQDELQLSHTRVQQTFGGIPVFQGEAIVHLRRDGSVFAVTDHLVRGLDLDVEPRISASDAADLAVLADGGGDE